MTRFARRCGLLAAATALVMATSAWIGAAEDVAYAGRAVRATQCRHVTYRAPSAGASGAIALTDATRKWGLDGALTGMLGHATAAGDVNGDGWTDLFVGTFADRPVEDYQVRGADGPAPDRLLLGGPGGFTPDREFPATLGRTSGAAFADLDRDGDLDLVVARNVRDWDRGRAPSEILANANGRFERATTLPEPLGARSIGVLDYDGDGLLDLFITEDRWTNGSSVLLRNEGGFRFTDVTTDSGVPDDVDGMGVATTDLDGNGSPDLFVGGSNRIFLNDGVGHFEEGNSGAFRWEVYGKEDDPAGVAVGDFNRDGRPDLVIGQHYNSTIESSRRVPIRLYTNEGIDDKGKLTFRDDTEAAGLVALPTKSPHVQVADFDNDGWPDILTTASAADRVTPIVFRNLGESREQPRFEPNAQPDSEQYWPSGVVLDADHDGRLDVVLVEWDPTRPTLILRNESGAGHWLGVVAGVGSVVDVFRAGRRTDAGARVASVVVSAATGYGSGAGPIAWFGLGDLSAVDVVITRADGRTTRLPRENTDVLIEPRCARVHRPAR